MNENELTPKTVKNNTSEVINITEIDFKEVLSKNTFDRWKNTTGKEKSIANSNDSIA